jgi:hypothetical protein
LTWVSVEREELTEIRASVEREELTKILLGAPRQKFFIIRNEIVVF